MSITILIVLCLWGGIIIFEPIRILIVRGLKQHRWMLGLKETMEFLSFVGGVIFYMSVIFFLCWVSLALYIYIASLDAELPAWALYSVGVSSCIVTFGVMIFLSLRMKVWKPKYSEDEKAIQKQEDMEFQSRHPRMSRIMAKGEALARKI